ncbi:MAG: DUF523 domain-containing protein [Verrucomicrobia bacterium]|nr:DUF523 domain-containing protein [Verrucomicrobiota bacterium]MDA1086019.1 DUF523 domain-containing protein [Verrucomicrobiota bacterium]
MTRQPETHRSRVGISSCLLGNSVRYDGGHKRDACCTDVLSDHFEWVSVCPEVEIGMGTPREAVRLVGGPAQPRMIGSETGHDWTDEMIQYARMRVQELVRLDLDGYVLKSKSPSCGMQRVAIDWGEGAPPGAGAGLFARELMAACPDLPVVEETFLRDPKRRESFVAQVASRRLRRTQSGA